MTTPTRPMSRQQRRGCSSWESGSKKSRADRSTRRGPRRWNWCPQRGHEPVPKEWGSTDPVKEEKMGLMINQNVAAMNAYRNLSATQDDMSKSLERLSSGLRINRAADDAAGL